MRYSLLAVLLSLGCPLFAQVANAEFDNVAKKFEKGAYESALESAEALMENDKHRKKPEPYLWASMCYYQIHLSDDEKMKERVKSPLRNALKYAGKAISKDKNGNLIDSNKAYFDKMKEEGVKEAVQYDAEGDYRKASSTLKQVMSVAPNDPFVQFGKGIMDIKLSSLTEAERELKVALPALEKNFRNLDYEPDPISGVLLKPGVLYYIDHLVESSYQDSAKKVAMSARVFFPLDEEVKQRYQRLE